MFPAMSCGAAVRLTSPPAQDGRPFSNGEQTLNIHLFPQVQVVTTGYRLRRHVSGQSSRSKQDARRDSSARPRPEHNRDDKRQF